VSTKDNVLPECRAREHKGLIFTPAGAYVPFFCANCGKHCGACPEENMTFMFYLCPKCEQTYGQAAGAMRLPDEDFWELLKQEQMAHFGYYPNQQELAKVLEEDSSPLAKLLKAGR
jgi:hypothetical protein